MREQRNRNQKPQGYSQGDDKPFTHGASSVFYESIFSFTASSGNNVKDRFALPRLSLLAGVVAKSVEIEMVVFRRAYVFVLLRMGILQPKRHLQRVKRLTIHYRIIDRL